MAAMRGSFARVSIPMAPWPTHGSITSVSRWWPAIRREHPSPLKAFKIRRNLVTQTVSVPQRRSRSVQFGIVRELFDACQHVSSMFRAIFRSGRSSSNCCALRRHCCSCRWLCLLARSFITASSGLNPRFPALALTAINQNISAHPHVCRPRPKISPSGNSVGKSFRL